MTTKNEAKWVSRCARQAFIVEKHGHTICMAELKSKKLAQCPYAWDAKRETELCAVANPLSTNHANKREITILIQFENASSLCACTLGQYTHAFKHIQTLAHTHTRSFFSYLFLSLAYTRDSSNSIACIHHLLVFRNIDLCLAIHCEIIRMTVESRLKLW